MHMAARGPLRHASKTAATSTSAETTNSDSGAGSSGRSINYSRTAVVAAASLAVGFALGRVSERGPTARGPDRVLPSGLPRSCCSCDESPATTDNVRTKPDEKTNELTPEQKSLPAALASIVESRNVIPGAVDDSKAAPYLKGARLGHGEALCIVSPGTLVEAVECLQKIVDSGCVVVPQGANTGLTGGSVPRGGKDDGDDARPSVVMSMRRLDTIFPIDGGDRVVCMAGAGIADLAERVPKWFPGRESHSVLGSIFLNPTTSAGVAFGSGGTQLRKGPAYTNRAMYAKVHSNKWGENIVEVVNALGIDGIEDTDFPFNCGKAIEQLDIYRNDVKEGYRRVMGSSSKSEFGTSQASDTDYGRRVCNLEGEKGDEVSRYNADTRGRECNRCEGKVLILATVHDTFPAPTTSKSFWISFDSLETALAFRTEVCLDNPTDLPVSVEYMDRDAFDIIDRSGRVLGNMIKVIGIGSIVGALWNLKLKIEALPFESAPLICDKILHVLNNFTPTILPSRFMDSGRKMDHHVSMTVGEYGDGTLDRLLNRMQSFASRNGSEKVMIQECRGSMEERSLNAFRFVAAPAFRTWCVGEGVQGFSVDYALPKSGGSVPDLGPRKGEEGMKPAVPLKRMRYSHFGCNVVHEDLAYGLDVDIHAAKMELKQQVEKGSGGRLPAEHGHGTEYKAPQDTQERWKKMDPLNVLNPGIGGLSSRYCYK